MKGMALLALMVLPLLGGCGGLTSLEQLEATAMLTGDWTEVEKRERILERRKLRAGPQCSPGRVAVCEAGAGSERCSCVRSANLHSLLGGR